MIRGEIVKTAGQPDPMDMTVFMIGCNERDVIVGFLGQE